MSHSMKLLVGILSGIGLSVNTAHSHHSFAASFTEEEIQTEGFVSEYLFRNPHVIIYLIENNDAGGTTRWMAEGAAATGMRRAGWSTDTIEVGEYVRITGEAGRDGRPMISLRKIEVLDPETHVVLRTPSLERSPITPVASSDTLPLRLEDGRPNLTGIWVQGSGPPSFLNNEPPPFNETGIAVQATVNLANDPQYACQAPGLVRQAGWTPHPVKITQNDDHVIVEYEEYAGKRTIYFDEREFELVDGSMDPLGRSKAQYEEDALVVESDQIPTHWSGIFGYQLSNRTTTVETYRRKDDPVWGPALEMTMAIDDPGHLYAPWEISWTKYYSVSGIAGAEVADIQEDYKFLEVECRQPLSNN